MVLESAAQYQQSRVLAGVERIRYARAGSPSEAVWLVVVASTIAVKGSETARRLLLLWKCHVSRDTPL
jgi:hypothetical protein